MKEGNYRMNKVISKVNKAVNRIDQAPMWWVGLILIAIIFSPFLILKEGSVFAIHDQLDETILSYVLNAKYLWTGTTEFPEMMGGLHASGMQPSAVLFIPLYRFLPAFEAFLIQYLVVCACGFFGMYFCVKELTSSSILAVAMAGCFCMLPAQPVYGLSILGVPMLLYACLCIYQKKQMLLSFLLILFFGLTTHLVLIGYVVLGLWALALLVLYIQKQNPKWLLFGFLFLTGIYVVVNKDLFLELFIGQSSYISHREELVNYGSPFWETVKGVFFNSAQHAESLHKYLILPILVLLVIEAIGYGRKSKEERKHFLMAMGGMVLLLAIAFIYAFCTSELVAGWKNSINGFLRYFQMERFYWLYPAAWYLEFALVFRLWWAREKEQKLLQMPIIKLIALAIILLPTMKLIVDSSYFYMNVNQINNGSGITGYISWESYYAEDLMQELEDAIGREVSDYRVASLGISPTPALMHGFYTVDGYSNNYSLEYKHQFRQVIARELEKNDVVKAYFDGWGSRCYLFNNITGNYWSVSKNSGVTYEKLEFDMEALKALGCEYLFSGGEITDARRMGLESMGYYTTDKSYWGIWLYKLQ